MPDTAETGQTGSAFKMAALVGELEKYTTDVNWPTWESAFKNFVELNQIPEAKRSRVFALYVGLNTSKRLRESLMVENIASEPLETLLQKSRELYAVPVNKMLARYRFYKRHQQAGEDIATFVADLKRLASDCQFRDVSVISWSLV